MNRVRLEVIKKDLHEDLAREYGRVRNGEFMSQPCTGYKVGQVWFSEDARKPAGFCEDAWRSVYQFVFAFANGAQSVFDGRRTARKDIAITCCNDGIRPVYFKIEPAV
jgi:uncharacterized repeat protein (TIGR04076 family)